MVIIHKELVKYLPLIDFLADMLGESTEIVMHDISDVDKSVVAIRNGHVSNRTVGAPATKVAMKFINDRIYEKSPYVLNYKGKDKYNKTLKSSTYFIKDENGNVVGMICINIDIDNYLRLKNDLDKIINFSDFVETEEFPNSLDEIAGEYIDKAIVDSGVDPERMTVDEKIDIIKELNKRDAFSYKGMVINVAKKLKVSEPTIYRYLNKIKNE